ncbi:hypothetical protein [Hymenobacter terrenus]|uniref:hypothetical protein n=1 Tax=Hymenobacter terrenus TaxID=1629124 RepID=UPI000619FB34|nr:hypothetical protein [Hymenobacter terrenus]
MIIDYNATFEAVPGQGYEKLVRTRVAPAGKDYPTLYLQMIFKANSKTHRVNPATVKRDVKLRVRPYDNYDPNDEFNAPHDGLEVKVDNEIVSFEFIYTVTIRGGAMKVSGGYKEFINVEKEITTSSTRRGLVLVKGELNTVHEYIAATAYKWG